MVWTVEGMFGVNLVGKRSILRKPIDQFLNVGREGTQALGEALVNSWKWFWVKVGYPRKGPTNPKRALRIFLVLKNSLAVLFTLSET